MRAALSVVALAAVLATGCGAAPSDSPSPAAVPSPFLAAPSPTSTPRPRPELRGTPRAGIPKRILIPSVGVDAPIVQVGLQTNGHMETPPVGRAGWYKPRGVDTPRPGEVGPAVIAAHVDSVTGPDVFYRLKEIKRGARVTVVDEHGERHEFAVERVAQTPKPELPVREIWGATSGPALRLITCGGEFDRRSGHYRDNVTVFAAAAR